MREGSAAEYLCDDLQYVGKTQPYRLRNASDFKIERVISTSQQKTIFYKGLILYNKIPNELKNENNIHIFKRNVTSLIKNNTL